MLFTHAQIAEILCVAIVFIFIYKEAGVGQDRGLFSRLMVAALNFHHDFLVGDVGGMLTKMIFLFVRIVEIPCVVCV